MTDRKGALFALQQEQTELRQVQCVLCESGYVATPLSQGVGDILGPQVKVEITRTEPATFKVMPKHGVVKRKYGLEKHRRVWKTGSAGAIRAYSACVWHFALCCLDDFEQALRNYLLFFSFAALGM